MSYKIKVSQAAFKDADTSQYLAVDVLAEQTKAGLISEIQQAGEDVKDDISSAGAAEVAAIEQKGVETRESIPDDYSALQDEVDDLKSAFNEIVASESSNLFNKEDVSTGGYYGGHANGVVYGDQNDWVTNNTFQDSGLIPYDKTKVYATNISNRSSFYIRLWDNDKKYVGMRQPKEITWSGNVFTPSAMSATPSYISIAMSSDENIDTIMVCENQIPEVYEPYGKMVVFVVTLENINTFIKGEYPTYQKKLGCLGDSITYGAGGISWVTRMAKLCGLANVINYGVSGSCISDAGQDGHSFIERYPDMADDLDYLTIWGGVNDILYRGATAQEFKQKYEELIEGIREKLPYCKILILTPMKFDVTGTQGARTNKWNEARLYDGNMPVDYVNAEIEIAEKYCIKFINMWTESGVFVDMQKTQLMPDGIHPNTKCNLEYLAPLIAEALKSF